MTGPASAPERPSDSRAVLYLLHSGNLFGTERMALATLMGMDEYDKRVVLAPRAYGMGSVADAARAAGFESVTFAGRFGLVASLLPWFARYKQIDVIGTSVFHNVVCFGLAKLMFVRLRQLQVVHGGVHEAGAYGRKRLLNRIPVRLVAVSQFVRSKLLSHGARSDSISVIDNFFSDTQLQAYGARPRYVGSEAGTRPVDRGRVRVAIVSRLDPIKRIDVLVDTLHRHGLGEFEFDLYGTGTDFDALKARSAGLANLRLHGFVPDVNDRLPDADFLLHLCPEEPFGLAILEAFVTGLVAIVPDAGGAGSLVEDGATGLKFAANDVDDLVRVLQRARLLDDSALQRMADAGMRRVDESFSQQQGLRRYRQALADSGS